MSGKASKDEEEFKITEDEMGKIKKALKDEEFRKLFMDYANEISDPENKKKYEEEILAMERQRGQDVKLLNPIAGFVVKTKRLSNSMKVFINICTSFELQEHTSNNEKRNGVVGTHYHIPHSITPMREDLDKDGKSCHVYDACFHPNTYQKANENASFRKLLIDTTFDALENQLKEFLDRKNLKFPKLKYKGTPQPSIIRNGGVTQKDTTSYEAPRYSDVMQPNGNTTSGSEDHEHNNVSMEKEIIINGTAKVTPKHEIIHRGYFDMQSFTNNSSVGNINGGKPKELVIKIQLAKVSSASELDLDIFEKQLLLKSADYHLDVPLPYSINEDKGKAQFDKASKTLTVTLPLSIQKEKVTTNSLVQEISSSIESNNLETRNDTKLVEGEKERVDNVTGTSDSTVHAEDESLADNDDKTFIDHINIDIEENKRFTKVEYVDPLDDSRFKSFQFNRLELPPYTYDESLEKIMITINVAKIQVIDLSIGFSHQEVYISFPQQSDNLASPDWSIFVRTIQQYSFNKDECGFEVADDCLKVRLVKDACSLWSGVYIGATENDLQLVQLTGDVQTDVTTECSSTMKSFAKPSILSMEGRLNQLLKEQSLPSSIVEDCGEVEACHVETDKVLAAESNVDDAACSLKLMDLQDDVIEEISPLPSPGVECNKNSRFATQRVFERSMSHDYITHPRLKSILKRSKSDSGNIETDEEYGYSHRRTAVTMSDDYYTSTDDDTNFRRRRHKSVSFSEKPIVFEFQKISRRQWKKQFREESRNNNNRFLVQRSPSNDSTEENVESKQKQSKKKKKGEKKQRNRNNSESRSEEENEQTVKKSKQRKKKKKKTGANHNITNSGGDSSGVENNLKDKSPLNNPLIFQLD